MLSFETGWGWVNKKGSSTKNQTKAFANNSDAFFDVENIQRTFARCFAGKDGDKAINYLKKLTYERPLSPDNDDVNIWHLEGQRYLTAHIIALVERGRKG